jgi:hypothetical protein
MVTFFISFGSLGFKNEIFILCIGIVYLLLSYLAKIKNSIKSLKIRLSVIIKLDNIP